MSNDLEKRMTAMERVQDKLLATLDQINATLLKFEKHIDELFDMKSKLDSVDVMWRRIDDLQIKTGQIDTAFQILRAEHMSCSPKVAILDDHTMGCDFRLSALEKKSESSSAFMSQLWGGILSKTVWGLIVGGAMSAIYLAGKGAFK